MRFTCTFFEKVLPEARAVFGRRGDVWRYDVMLVGQGERERLVGLDFVGGEIGTWNLAEILLKHEPSVPGDKAQLDIIVDGSLDVTLRLPRPQMCAVLDMILGRRVRTYKLHSRRIDIHERGQQRWLWCEADNGTYILLTSAVGCAQVFDDSVRIAHVDGKNEIVIDATDKGYFECWEDLAYDLVGCAWSVIQAARCAR